MPHELKSEFDFLISELSKIIAKYITTNSKEARELIVKNIDSIKKTFPLHASNVFRYWNFPENRVLDLIMGYSLRIGKEEFLSYYAMINRTKTIFNSLNNDRLLGIVEKYTPNNDVYLVTDFLKDYLSDELLTEIEKYKNEAEAFRVGVNDYTLNIYDNIKYIILHREIVYYAKIASESYTSLNKDYVMIDVTSNNNIAMLRSKLTKLYSHKEELADLGLGFFKKHLIQKAQTPPPPSQIKEADFLTPAGKQVIMTELV